VKTPLLRNPLGRPGVVPYTDPINEAHVSEQDLVVVDVAAADDATALSFQQMLAGWWATATAERTTRDAGEPGARLRCLDLRQKLPAAAVVGRRETTEIELVMPHGCSGGPDGQTGLGEAAVYEIAAELHVP
jgi:hypothetical protein